VFKSLEQHLLFQARLKSKPGVVYGVLKYLCRASRAATLLQTEPLFQSDGLHMTATRIHLCERLKQLGFSRQSQIRLYGSQFELVGDPLVISEDVVFVDAVERKSGESCRVRIPLNIVKMATEQASETDAA
jgi:hypothetical protein